MNQDRTRRQIEIAAAITGEIRQRVAEGVPADTALAAIFRDRKEFGSRDRRVYAHAVFSYFRWRGWLEARIPGPLAHQCVHAVLADPATEPAHRTAWAEAAAITEGPALLPESLDATGLESLMPAWLAEALPDVTLRHDLIHACTTRPPTWLTVPSGAVASFEDILCAAGLSYDLDNRMPGAIAVTSRFQIEALERAWGQAVQVQDIGSQAVMRLCQAATGQRWWDACAGAGGKSLALARAVEAGGEVLATDIRLRSLDNLGRRAERHRLATIRTLCLDAAHEQPDGLFDGVLVDAPCSGIGTWPRNPDARWRTSPADIESSVIQQATILEHAAQGVRPGGRLVYAVCTLTPVETQNRVASFLEHHPEFVLQPVQHPLNGAQTNGCVTIRPSEGPGDGMFAAVMIRL